MFTTVVLLLIVSTITTSTSSAIKIMKPPTTPTPNVSYLLTFSNAFCGNGTLSYSQKLVTGQCNNMTLDGVPASFITTPTHNATRRCASLIWSGRDKTCKSKQEPQVFPCDRCMSLIPEVNFMITGCDSARPVFHSLCKWGGSSGEQHQPCGKCLVQKSLAPGMCQHIDSYVPMGHYSLGHIAPCPDIVEYQNYIGRGCRLKVLPQQPIPVGLCMNATMASLVPPPS